MQMEEGKLNTLINDSVYEATKEYCNTQLHLSYLKKYITIN